MKRLTYISLALFALFIIGCKKDKVTGITSEQLAQSIWEGNKTSYDTDDNPYVKTPLILEFLSETEGQCILQDSDSRTDFQYSTNRSLISFTKSPVVRGDWYILESSENHMILLSYNPRKTIMTLVRAY